MKTYQRIALSWAVIFLVGCMVASAASAVTFLLTEWLAGGTPIGILGLTTDQEGELELEDTKVLGVSVKILCSGVMDGFVESDGGDDIWELLSLAGVATGEPLVGSGLTCTNTANCGGTPKAWAAKMPWTSSAELMVDGIETFFVDLVRFFTFESECTVLGVKVTDTCEEPEVVTELTNEAGGLVDVKFSRAFQELAGLGAGACSIGGGGSAVATGLVSALLTSGTALTVSSE
jgi:hypothetical protein